MEKSRQAHCMTAKPEFPEETKLKHWWSRSPAEIYRE